MMEKNNRTSYMAPPAPRALKRDGSRDSTSYSPGMPAPTSASASQSQSINTSPPHQRMTPTSGEIPLNLSQREVPVTVPNSYRSPAPPSLEHLSLETGSSVSPRPSNQSRANPPPIYINGSSSSRSNTPRDQRYAHRTDPTEPMSAIEGPTRPFFGTRSQSSQLLGSSGLSSSNSTQGRGGAGGALAQASPAGIGMRSVSPSLGGTGLGIGGSMAGGGGGMQTAALPMRPAPPPQGPLPMPPMSAGGSTSRRHR